MKLQLIQWEFYQEISPIGINKTNLIPELPDNL